VRFHLADYFLGAVPLFK